jgi:anti-sigma28 factor (negative regulator of flagellin synthesis)
MEIQSTQYTQQIQNIQGIRIPNKTAVPAETQPVQGNTAGKDEVSFSGKALKLSDAMTNNAVQSEGSEQMPVRFDLVNRIKKEIDAGTYDTPDKMDIALDRMFSRLIPG